MKKRKAERSSPHPVFSPKRSPHLKFPKDAARGQKPPMGAQNETNVPPPLYLYFNDWPSGLLISQY